MIRHGGVRRVSNWVWICCLVGLGMVLHAGQASAQSDKGRAGQLYAEARALYFDKNRDFDEKRAAAVSVLKVLIERYPTSPFAGDARSALRDIAAETRIRNKAGRTLQPPRRTSAADEEDSLNVPAPSRKFSRRSARRAGSQGRREPASTAARADGAPPVNAPLPKRLRAGSRPAAAATARIVPAPKRARRPRLTVPIRKQPVRRRADIRLWDETADRVFFGEGVVRLGARARPVLADQAAWLKKHPDLSVTVLGHADDRGSAQYNKQIARQRAEAVRDRLIEEGVSSGRIVVKAFGKEQRIAPCKQAGCAAQNRRAVTVVSSVGRGGGAKPLSQIGRAANGRRIQDRTVLRARQPARGR